MLKKSYFLLGLIIAVISMPGCGKKEEKPQDEKQPAQETKKESVKQIPINLKDINEDIKTYFKQSLDYIYPNGRITSQETVPIQPDYTYIANPPKYRSSVIIIQTSDPIETVLEHYKNMFAEDKIKKTEREGNLMLVSCIKNEQTGGYNNLPYEIQLRISQPYRNFPEDILKSQLSVITTQISQYEKIMEAQKARKQAETPDSQNLVVIDNAIKHCENQIQRLKSQSAVLSEKSSLVELHTVYTTLDAPRKQIKRPVEKDNTPKDNETTIQEKDNSEKDNEIKPAEKDN